MLIHFHREVLEECNNLGHQSLLNEHVWLKQMRERTVRGIALKSTVKFSM